MSLSRRRWLTLVGATALAGCSTRENNGADTPTATATPTETPDPYTPTLHGGRPDGPASEVAIGMTCDTDANRYYFLPSLVWLASGESLTWSVQSRCRQWTVAYHPDNDRQLRMPEDGQPWQSPVYQGSGTFTHRLEEPGVYDAVGLHEAAGQVATVLVGRPNLDDQPALNADDGDLPPAARKQLALHHDVVRELLA
ncbi:MAG: hypothetical protein ACOCQM_03635 [Natronomonas sp.]